MGVVSQGLMVGTVGMEVALGDIIKEQVELRVDVSLMGRLRRCDLGFCS